MSKTTLKTLKALKRPKTLKALKRPKTLKAEGSEDFKDLKDSKDSEETEGSEDTEDNFNNFQDLLQIMEEMQMLPFIQTDKDRFQSMHFNMFLSPGRSLKDLTFLVAKKTTIAGG
jgi:hypothetical protein